MAVPDFQSWFIPLLRGLGDGAVHPMAELYERLADDMALSSDDRAERLESGSQFTYQNRIGWARTYLKKAGLLKSPARALVQITDRGQQVLQSPPTKLNVRFLKQFPEFLEFHKAKPKASGGKDDVDDGDTETPQDALERVYKELNEELAQELLERVKGAPPAFFEKLVVDLLIAMGYGGSRESAGQIVGKSGDGGVDGIINEDRLGLDVVYIQAKRWESTVGRPVVQAFAGSIEGFRAKKGVLITTSTFSEDARSYASKIEKRIVLIDGKQLAQLMIQFGVGVSTEARYEVKRVDGDFFEV